MTQILCNWLNNEVKLSEGIDIESFHKQFSNGYLIGEVLNKYGMQDDFDQFSINKTQDAKLNNFGRLEPQLKVLGVEFNVKRARQIMEQVSGVAATLLYELFVALENKRKANLTGTSLQTMQPTGTAKLQAMEHVIYNERIKKVTPRQTDLNLEDLVRRFKQHMEKSQEKAINDRIMSAEGHKKEAEEHRKRCLDRSYNMRVQQSEMVAKIQAAIVQIPKPPPNQTLEAIKDRKVARRKKEAADAMEQLDVFEDRLSRTVLSNQLDEEQKLRQFNQKMMMIEDDDDDLADDTVSNAKDWPISAVDSGYGNAVASGAITPSKTGGSRQKQLLEFIKPASNEDYIGKIRERLEQDKNARSEREKRRRKVLVDCMQAHHQLEENQREEMLANRLMRQSQMERRIAVQLLHLRHEKEIIKQNRMEREKQYQARREHEFVAAMDKERETIEQSEQKYAEKLAAERATYEKAQAERKRHQYEKHYRFAESITEMMFEFALKIGDYRELTEKKIPGKLFEEWKEMFVKNQLFDENQRIFIEQKSNKLDASGQEISADVLDQMKTNFDLSRLVEEKENILDDYDLIQYQSMKGEWEPSGEEKELLEKATKINPVILWIINRLYSIVKPRVEEPIAPNFPPYKIKAAIVGKCFSGKTSIIRRLAQNNKCVAVQIDNLIQSAIEAYENMEEDPNWIDEKTKSIQMSPTDRSIDPNNTTEKIELLDEDPVGPPVEPTESNTLDENSSNPTKTNMSEASGVGAPDEFGDDEAKINNAEAANTKTNLTVSGSPIEVNIVKENLSPRAILGRKVADLIKEGKTCDDQLMIDLIIEFISRLDAETGWILDGFPVTYAQSKMLEKALTGRNQDQLESAEETTAKSMNLTLSFDPYKQSSNSEADQTKNARSSGLDAIILLETSDMECFKRSAKISLLSESPQKSSSILKNNSFKGLTEAGTDNILERQTAGSDNEQDEQNNEIDNIHLRIANFIENWPKIEKLYTAKQTGLANNLLIVNRVDSGPCRNLETVYLEVETLLDKIVEKLKEPPVQVPDVTAADASLEKEDDTLRLSDKIDTMEVLPVSEQSSQPTALPDQKGASTPRSSRKRSPKGSKNSRTGSADSKKSNSSEKNSKKSAKKEKDSDKRSSRNNSKSKSPAGKGGGSKSRDSSAGSKKGGKGKKKSMDKAGAQHDTLDQAGALDDLGAGDDTEPIAEPSKPGDADWIYVDNSGITPNLASSLHIYWEDIQLVYFSKSRELFRNVRAEKEAIIRFLYGIREGFQSYLRRPDAKQEYISQFQKFFNEFPDDMRRDEEAKSELHCRTDRLRDDLFDMSQENQTMAETKLNEIKVNTWPQDHIGMLSNLYLSLVQAEFERFQDILRFLKDYYRSVQQPIPDEYKPDFVRMPMIELETEPELEEIQTGENGRDEENDQQGVAADMNESGATGDDGVAGSKKKDAGKGKEKAAAAGGGKDKNTANAAAPNQLANAAGVPLDPITGLPLEDFPKKWTQDEIELLFKMRIPLIGARTPAAQIAAAILSSQVSAPPAPAKGGAAGGKGDKAGGAAGGKADKGGGGKGTGGKAGSGAGNGLGGAAGGGIGVLERLSQEMPSGPEDADCRMIFDAFTNALQFMSNYIEIEAAALETEEDAEKVAQSAEKDTGKGGAGKGAAGKGAPPAAKGADKKSRSPSPKKGGTKKDDSKSPDKSSKSVTIKEKSKSRTTIKQASSITFKDLDTEEQEGKQIKDKIRTEYLAALEMEGMATRYRIQRIFTVGGNIIEDLKSKVENCHKDMFSWIGGRVLQEDQLIRETVEVFRYGIENNTKIVEPIQISEDHLYLNTEETLIKQPGLPNRLPPVDPVEGDHFKIKHIEYLYEKINEAVIQGGGLITTNDFLLLLNDIQNTLPDPDCLPEFWTALLNSSTAIGGGGGVGSRANNSATSASHLASIEQLTEAFSPDQEYVDWRSFLVSACQPWPWPSQQQLLETLYKFEELDQNREGFVTREQFDFINLWFVLPSAPTTPVDRTQPKLINRMEHIKRIFFDIFKFVDYDSGIINNNTGSSSSNSNGTNNNSSNVEKLYYENFLLHFAQAAHPYDGLIRALSVTMRQHVPHLLPDQHMISAAPPDINFNCNFKNEEIPQEISDAVISIQAIYKVLSFGQSRFQLMPYTNKVDDASQMEAIQSDENNMLIKSLISIFQMLDSEQLQPINLSRLLKHSLIVELFGRCNLYKKVEIKHFFISNYANSGDLMPQIEDF